MPWLVGKRAALARDSEKGFECFFVKVPFRVLGRVIGHHCLGECVASGSDQDACKLRKEEIGVCGNGIVETRLAKRKECLILLGSGLDAAVSCCDLRHSKEMKILCLQCHWGVRRNILGIEALEGDSHSH